ncbi:CarD family transcriptional regulator [Rhodobiaceae bacterium]|nr:CarD family transcriptional regulator [Rhodobiaceae bacterium]
MSVAKKPQIKKTKKKSPKTSDKKKSDKQIKKPTIKKKASPKNKPSKKESKSVTTKSKVSQAKLKDGFLPDQYVVYPSHGVGKVIEIEKREIAGQLLEMYVIEFEKEKMTQRVPIGKIKENGVRKVSTKNQLKEIFEILTGKAKIRRTMWSRRAQEYEAKINSGDIKLLAEVVRDLFRSDSQPEQSYSERQLYEASRERLAREVAVIEKTDEQKAIEKMETILNNSNGRNDDLESEEID